MSWSAREQAERGWTRLGSHVEQWLPAHRDGHTVIVLKYN